MPVTPSPISLFTSGPNHVEYQEFVDGSQTYHEEWHPHSPSVTRTLQCDWDDRYDFLEDLLGKHEWQSTGHIKRTPPEVHPDLYMLRATSATLIEHPGRIRQEDPTGLANFEVARYRVTYTPLPYLVLADDETPRDSRDPPELGRWVQKTSTMEGENLPIPNGSFGWAEPPNQNASLNEAPAIFRPTKGLIYTWHDVPSEVYPGASFSPVPPNIEAINAALGTVNSASFDYDAGPTDGSGKDGWQPYTLLFVGVEYELYPHANMRQFCWRISYKFSYNPTTWIKPFDPVTNTFRLVRLLDAHNEATGEVLYRGSDFADLFKLPAF
jgi:hypothetical protein